MKRSLLSLFSLSLLFLNACGENRGFLYRYEEPGINPTQDVDHQIQFLSGNVAVDMLWVIDNSGSMSEEQAAVMQNTSTFMNLFTQNTLLNWRMGLLSTDYDERPYVGFAANDLLDNTTPDPVAKFVTAVSRLGINGSPDEMTFDPIYKQLGNYPSFLRTQALLAVIAISDEPEQSYNHFPATNPAQKAKQFYDYLLTLKNGDTSKVVVHTIAKSKNPYSCTGNEIYTMDADGYGEIAKLSGGNTYSIDCPRFSDLLLDMTRSILSKVVFPKVFLKKRPIPSTIKVFYNGVEVPGGVENGKWVFNVETNEIVFTNTDFLQQGLDSVEVIFDEDKGWRE